MSETTSRPSVRSWQDWVGLFARLIPGLVFIYAAITKIGNIPWFVYSIEAYQISFLQAPMSVLLGHVLPFVELLAGVLLVIGLLTRWSAGAILIMLLGFMGGIAWVWSQGIPIDCGCFGSGGPVAPEDTNYPMKMLENLGMSVLTGWLVLRPRSLVSVDSLLFRGSKVAALPNTFDEPDEFGQPEPKE